MSIEAQHEFIATLNRMVNYWMNVDLEKDEYADVKTPIDRQRVERIVHTILCMMDGVASYCESEVVLSAIKGPEMLHELWGKRRSKGA